MGMFVSGGMLLPRLAHNFAIHPQYQIMTDLRPYAKWSDVAVVLAIAQNKAPADLSEASLPDFALETLKACWRQSPHDRPTMNWCKDVLYHRKTVFFGTDTKDPLTNVPDGRKNRSENWNAVFNPPTRVQYHIEFSDAFGNVNTRYAQTLHPEHFPALPTRDSY